MPDERGNLSWEQAVLRLREQPQQQQLVLDCYYDDPLEAAARRYWQSEEWASVRTFLPPGGGRALDVGAGRGIASYALARDGFDVTALEPDPSAVVGAEAIRSLAREGGLNISVTQEFSESLPFPDGQFDVVFARAVLHHCKDLEAACREFHRVLRPGGRLVAVREHVISQPGDLPAFFEVHPLHRLYGGENAFLLAQYEQALSASGFFVRHTLAPFESPINYAPHTRASLCRELANRLPLGRTLVAGLLAWDPVWALVTRLLRRVDDRPGRLYSFVADRS